MSVDKFGRMSFHPLSKYRRISGDVYDIQNRRIVNLESPDDEKDGVNKMYVDMCLEALETKFNTRYHKQEFMISNMFDDLISRIDKCVELIKGGVQLEHLRAYFESELNLEKNRLLNILSENKSVRDGDETSEAKQAATENVLLRKGDLIKILQEWKIPLKGKYSLMSSTSLQEFITGGAVS